MIVGKKHLEWKNLQDDFCPKCYGEMDNDTECLTLYSSHLESWKHLNAGKLY